MRRLLVCLGHIPKAKMKMHPKPKKTICSLFVIIILLYMIITRIDPIHDDQESNSNHQKYCNKNVAENFKENLDLENVFKRSQNCRNYFETLAALIYNLPPDQVINIKKYTNPDAKIYNKKNSMAVSYVIHNNPGLFEILFHIMFRPYNDYCIIIDAKSSIKLKTTFQSIIKCYKQTFPRTNIIIANWTLPIYYLNITGYSSLNADLTCLELMYKSSSNWKYHINVAGTELPMYSLDDFSAMLNSKNMPYAIESSHIPQMKPNRWMYKYIEETGAITKEFLKPVPFNLTIFKGQRGVVLSRNYTKFILEEPVAQKFQEWIKETAVPEESYLQTLVRISHIQRNGSKIINVTQNFDKSFDTTNGIYLRYAKWYHADSPVKCHGIYIHQICHLALEDYNEILLHFAYLTNSRKKPYFILNKFNLDVDARPIIYLARLQSPILKGF